MKTVTFLLGPRTSFRGYARGRIELERTETNARTGEETRQFKLMPAKHTVVVPDEIAEGMVATSKEWEENNRRHPPTGEGSIQRMFKVLECKAAPANAVAEFGTRADPLEELVGQVATKSVQAVLEKIAPSIVETVLKTVEKLVEAAQERIARKSA